MAPMSLMPPPSCSGILIAAENRLDRPRVHRAAREGAVEIDDMQIFEPLALEEAGLRCGILVEDRGPRHVALLEAHALALLQINRRKQNHGVHLRKLAMSDRPSA